MVFDRLKKALKGDAPSGDEYVEIDITRQEKEGKIMVKLFTLKTYEDVNEILNFLREGFTIAIVDIKPLRTKDSIELKRAISKVKKTVEALEGSIAGFGENTVIAVPPFAKIHKETLKSVQQEEAAKKNRFEMY